VAATIARRKDFDEKEFQRWLSELDANDQQVWKDSPPKLELLQTFENDTYMLRGLAVYLCGGSGGPAAAVQSEVMQLLQKR
jgi:hypothetical protein